LLHAVHDGDVLDRAGRGEADHLLGGCQCLVPTRVAAEGAVCQAVHLRHHQRSALIRRSGLCVVSRERHEHLGPWKLSLQHFECLDVVVVVGRPICHLWAARILSVGDAPMRSRPDQHGGSREELIDAVSVHAVLYQGSTMPDQDRYMSTTRKLIHFRTITQKPCLSIATFRSTVGQMPQFLETMR